MSNLEILGRGIVKDIITQNKNNYYQHINRQRLNKEVYTSIGKNLFENKKEFMDYMNYLYQENFSWENLSYESQWLLENIVNKEIENSKKYKWDYKRNIFIPVFNRYSFSENKVLDKVNFSICIIENEVQEKEAYIEKDCTSKGKYFFYTFDIKENMNKIFKFNKKDLYSYIENNF